MATAKKVVSAKKTVGKIATPAKKVPAKVAKKKTAASNPVSKAKFPRHALAKAIRIPQVLFDQNAGKSSTKQEAAKFLGLGSPAGPFAVEISSALKFGLLEQPEAGRIQPTALAKQILRPQSPADTLEGYRKAILNAPDISEVYQHYRGENLPDDQFLRNTVVETYKIPIEAYSEFKQILLESLATAELISSHGDKTRIVDVTSQDPAAPEQSDRLKRLERTTVVGAHDTCFVMQPFASPLGDYYEKIYKIAIEKAGLRPIRADAEIFATGKIMDQVWNGINSAKVLVAELTSRNPNVFYELGLAHALKKPVVLVSAKEDDVPFDLQHIRVIYYDVTDPFWGSKLIEKFAENILSAIRNPEEAVFRTSISG